MPTAADSLSDAAATSAVLLAMLIGRWTGLAVDGYVGMVVALFILFSAYKAAKETLSPLLGQAPDPELVQHIRDIVEEHDTVVGIHDLVVHDYGPGRCHVSLHAEVDGEGNIYELHEAIDRAMSELDHKLGCFSVIHMDPVDTKNERLAEMREETVQLLRQDGTPGHADGGRREQRLHLQRVHHALSGDHLRRNADDALRASAAGAEVRPSAVPRRNEAGAG